MILTIAWAFPFGALIGLACTLLLRLALRPRKALVRVHQIEGRPTLEGILVARKPVIRLEAAKLIEAEDRTIELDGGVEILREHVTFLQLLARSA